MTEDPSGQSLGAAPSRGRFYNSGTGPSILPLDIGHQKYAALLAPDTAFWMLIRKEKLVEALTDANLISTQRDKAGEFAREMDALRFHLQPSAVYFNPTERCNLNCSYCYIPEEMRKSGAQMPADKLLEALARLREYFKRTMSEGRLPQVVFHGAEPLLNREAVFAGIEEFRNDFRFGVQTNATLLDDEALDFLTSRGVGIGISLDGPVADIADQTRKTWSGDGTFPAVVNTIKKLTGYEGFNVIATITEKNVECLTQLVEFFHKYEVPVCLLNVVRCTLPGAREIRAEDEVVTKHFLAALDRTYELFLETGRKLVVANFANVLVGIIAPTARRLMCDISPCGGGRCFLALAPNGDLFPCSEFIGLPEFKGGNLFQDRIEQVLESQAFNKITRRRVEDIEPCRRCAIRHFCGAPCPAEAHEMNGSIQTTGAYCEFYEEQVRYAFRLIADGRENVFLWDGWDKDAQTTFDTDMF